MSITAVAIALIAAVPLAGPVAGSVAGSSPSPAHFSELAAAPLAAGRGDEAIAMLERSSAANPHDAAVLINLGIAYAQAGEDGKARAAFEQAAACHEVIELQTADGSATDSLRLARKALKMLARGEFAADAARSGRLTYRN
jgi:tetratricopeptide (TPR) repeat protein